MVIVVQILADEKRAQIPIQHLGIACDTYAGVVLITVLGFKWTNPILFVSCFLFVKPWKTIVLRSGMVPILPLILHLLTVIGYIVCMICMVALDCADRIGCQYGVNTLWLPVSFSGLKC